MRRRELGAWLLVLPIGFGLTSVALLIYGNVTDLSTPAMVLASVTLFAAMVDGAATAIEGSRMRRLAETDSLTGLLNHGAFHAAVDRELVDHETTTSVLLFDLDDFKAVNDTHGHLAGDRLLRDTATALRAACRKDDVAGRLGGDEFGMLLPGCTPDTATAIARRLQAAIARLGDGVGISYGIAETPVDGTTRETLVAEADQRLYADKASRQAARLSRVA